MVTALAALTTDRLREALGLLSGDVSPATRKGVLRELQARFGAPGGVQAILDRAPEAARRAFLDLAGRGPTSVAALLEKRQPADGDEGVDGPAALPLPEAADLLPPPLDWLERRALITASEKGLVHVVEEARAGFAERPLDLPAPERPSDPVVVEPAATVVIATSDAALDRVVAVAATGLRAVGPTVAVSSRSPSAVTRALQAAGLRVASDVSMRADPDAPALPSTVEEAVGPRAVRALLVRAVADRRQIRLEYYASSRAGAATDRVVDPWEFADDLLRGYCHLRADERTFAVDRIGRAQLLPSPVTTLPPPEES